jgi:hypothetical protein
VTGTGGFSLTAVGVVYAATSANSNPRLSGTGVTNLAGTAATGVFTVNATGLTAGTAYSYAAYATNSEGTTYTSVGTFTTGPTPTLTFATPSAASVAGGATLANAVTSTLSGGSYGAISYTSSSPSVATVNATTGVVTGLSVGTTTITATQAAAPGFNAATSTSYTLTVTIDYTFSTLAGTAGSSGSADGTGSAARFNYPNGVAVDATGNVYIADEANHTIRKMTPGGVVTTLAGTAGSSGSTDGTGSAARFASPTGVAVDAAGNVYVADRANHTIRKITPGGVVTTLAGAAGDTGSSDGTGSAARFSAPRDVAVDASGNVYVADTGNHTIRRIEAGGVVFTLAGTAGSTGSTDGITSAARFNQPRGVVVDNPGNVYVADWLNHTIRKITPNGVVTTLAGTAGSSGSTDGTGSAARFNRPRGVAVDAAGNVYVGDQNNHTIRKIASGGVVTTLAGTAGSSDSTDGIGSAARFYDPTGVAVDAAGNLYVADQSNHTIRKGSLLPLLTTPTSANLAATTATLGGNVTTDGGTGITARGVVYAVTATNATPRLGGTGVTNVAGTGTTGVFTVDVTGLTASTAYSYAAYATNSLGTGYTSVGTFTTAATPTLTFTTPSTASVAAGATLTNAASSNYSGGSYGAISYTSSSPSVATVNATTGVVTGLSVGTTTITATQAAASGFNVTTSTSYTLTVTIEYTFSTLAGTAGSSGSADGTGSAARFNGPNGVAVDALGNVYVADTFNRTIRKMTPGGVVTTLAGTAGSSGSTDGTGSAARFTSAAGVAVDAAGNVYVADRGDHTIRKITSGGVVTTLAGTAGSSGSTEGTGTAARFANPSGVAVDAAGNVYVADRSNHTIRKITSGGVVTTLAGTAGSSGSTDGTGSAARFNDPIGVAVDATGNVYVAESLNSTIRKITSGGVVTTLAGTARSYGSTDGTGSAARFNYPGGVAVDAAGNVYVADSFNHTIRKITSGGVVTTLAGTAGSSGSTEGTGSAARFSVPSGVAVDAAGNLYVVEPFNYTIRKGSLPTPVLTTPTSASLTTTTATLGGNVTADGGISITARGVVYAVTATNATPQLGGTGVINVGGTGTTGVFTVNATGLTASTAYSYAAYATNAAGTAYTSVGTFTTADPTPTLTFTTPSTASVAVGATRANAVTSTLSGGSFGAISYKSSDTGKATVNPTTGVVTGLSVGTTTITATQAAAAGFNATTSTSYTLTVTIGTPTISAAPSATGIAFGQTLASSTLSGGTASVAGTFAFTTPSTAPGVGTAAQGVTFTPTDATNYTSVTTTVNVTVAKATPTITVAPTASGIIYGQTLAASTLNGGTASVAGTFTFTTPSTAPSAGTAAQGVTFTPTSTANYNAATTTVNVTVAKATPTVTWATPSRIIYGTALSATQLNATANVAGTFIYTPASGTVLTASIQSLSVGFTPTDAANYNAVPVTTVILSGDRASQTITFGTLPNRTYGAASFTVAATASSSLTTSYTIVSGPATLSGSTVTLTGAGTVVVRASQAGDSNYTAATPVDQSFTVAKKTLTVTADAKTKLYGAANPTLTSTITGYVNSETSAVVSGAATLSTTATATSTVGDYAITAAAGTLSATNYDFSFTAGTLTVTRAPLTVTADAKTRTYGAANPTLTATITGFVNSETSAVVSGNPALSTTATATSSVGGYPISAAAGTLTATNYSFGFTNGTLTVGKAALTVTADAKTKLYGAANPTLTATLTGFVNSETAAVLTGAPALSTTATTASGVNSYAITPALGTLVSANYSFGFVDGALAVTKAPLTVTADNKNRVYGAANPAFTATLTGFVNNDTAAVVTGAAALSSTVTPTSAAGPYPITPAIGTLTAANYAFTTFTNGTLTVGQTSQTLTFGALASKTFGDAAFSVSATSTSGLTPSYSIVSGPATISGSTVTITGAGTVVVRASQAGDGNYTAATPVDQSFTVAKATPTLIWATPSAITFGTALSATQLNATGSVAGTFAYSPASGTTPSVGTQTLSATFTPTDTANYNPASASVALSVVVAVPGSPTAITATTANGEATVAFTAPSNPGSSAITGYTIRATATDGSTVTVNATGSPAKVTGLTPGKSYRFTVTANNSEGSSESGTTSDALAISLVNQTITFAAPADRASNSGSFTLAATATSGLPVTFNVVSGPALLTGNVLDLTGTAGTVKIRASQAGNATYAAAPAVEVSFAVTAGSAQVVLSSVVNPATQKSEGTLGVVLTGSSRSGVLLLVSSGTGPSGTAEFTLGAGGAFTASFESTATPSGLPLDRGVQAASVTYTFTGTFVNNVLTGSIQPLGYGFKAEAPVNPPASATSVGLYTSTALSADSGTVYSLVGANNEVLVLVKTPTVTTGGLTTLKADGSYTLAATTTSGSVTLNGGVNPTTTTTTATLTLPGNTKVDFSGLNTETKRTDRLIGLASRAKVGTGESVLITGVAIGGAESKRVLIRAGGPALAAFGLASTLPNPTIKIYRGSTLIAQNDDWNPADAAEMGRLGLFAFPNGSKDAAILTTLAPGGYTAHISDLSGTGTGVALAEIYDASVNPAAENQRLISIASRGTVTAGDGALIGGFVVTGNAPKTLLIRGVGPALTGFGVAGALADPALTIYQDSKVITTNEGWANSAAIATAAIQTGAFALPSGSKDAAVLLTLSPGAYSAQVKSAKNASFGVALIEIYEVP